MTRPILLFLSLASFAVNSPAAGKITAVNDIPYELPPFVITRPGLGTDWTYGSIPGFEIISQCSVRETNEVVAALWRGRRVILPEALRPRFSQPMIVVLFSEPKAAHLGPLDAKRGVNENRSHWTNLIKRTLEDRESFAMNLWQFPFDRSPAFRFDTFTLLWRVAPAPPPWLNEGMFGGFGLYREGYYWYPGDEKKSLIGASWCDQAELKKALKLLDKARKQRSTGISPLPPSPIASFIPPLQRLLEEPPPATGTPEHDRWASTAALFVRWGNYDCPPEHVARFWRYVDRARREPVTENLFRDCFGFGYAEAHAELGWYLPIAVGVLGSALPGDIEPMPVLALKPATPLRVARLRGEWERMEAAALAPHHPDLAKRYREQAAQTLSFAIREGPSSDPGIHSSLGLLALDNNDLPRAREHLEVAVAGRVPGPRAYFELARLRWEADRLDSQGTLPPHKLTGVIDLILAAETQQPPLAPVYLLLVEALRRRSAPPTAPETAALLRGRENFPGNADLQRRIDALLERQKD